MTGVEYEPCAYAAEYAGPGRADQKSRAGVVAEAQQVRALLARDDAPLAHVGRRRRAERITAHDAHQKRRGSGAGNAEELGHNPGECARGPLRYAELHDGRAEHKKREQRWDYDLGTDA